MSEEFFRIFGVFDHGGTITDGQMLERDELAEKVAYHLRKNADIRVLTIIKVTKEGV